MKTGILAKYATYAIAILTATLINQFVMIYVKEHISQKGYALVLIDMLVVVVVFAPVFTLVVHFSKKFSSAYIKTSKKIGSTRRRGVAMGIFIAIILLFICYAYYRHGLHVLSDLGIWMQLKTSDFL